MIELETCKTVFPNEKFWRNVEITESCWLWTHANKSHPYGAFFFNKRSWPPGRFLKLQLDPPEYSTLQACHHCDTPPCVRPSHIFWGTAGDNVRDAIKKGRWGQRELSPYEAPARKLNDEHILFCRAFFGIASPQSIANAIGISRVHVGQIARARNWAHLPIDKAESIKELLRYHKRFFADKVYKLSASERLESKIDEVLSGK